MGLLANDFWNFRRYLEAKRNKNGGDKGGLAGTPRMEDVPDYHGPSPTKPDKPAVSGDHWSTGVKPKGTPAPYKGPGTDPGQKKAEKGGFAHMGDKELKYEPDAGIVDKAGEGGVQKKTWPKVATVKLPGQKKVESFLDDTKDMPLPEFAKYVQRQLQEHCGCENKEIPHVVAYTSGPYHPDPIQAIKYVTFLASENTNLMNALLREAKRLGCVDKLVEGLLTMPETYTEIVNQMTADSSVSNQIVRAMNDQYVRYLKIKEGVGPPAHRDEVEDEENTEDPSNDSHSEPDNIEGEEEPPGDDPEPEEDSEEPGFDPDTGSGGITTTDSPHKFAHQSLADAIKKHKELQKNMNSYMQDY